MKKYNLLGKDVIRDYGGYDALEEVVIPQKMKWRWFVAATFCTVIVLNILAFALLLNEKEARKRIRIGEKIYQQQQLASVNNHQVTYSLKDAPISNVTEDELTTSSLTPSKQQNIVTKSETLPKIAYNSSSKESLNKVENKLTALPKTQDKEVIKQNKSRIDQDIIAQLDIKPKKLNEKIISHKQLPNEKEYAHHTPKKNNKNIKKTLPKTTHTVDIIKSQLIALQKESANSVVKGDKKTTQIAQDSDLKDKLAKKEHAPKITKAGTLTSQSKLKTHALTEPIETLIHMAENQNGQLIKDLLDSDERTIASVLRQEDADTFNKNTNSIDTIVTAQIETELETDDNIITGSYTKQQHSVLLDSPPNTSKISILQNATAKNKEHTPSKNVQPNVVTAHTTITDTLKQHIQNQKITIQPGQNLSGILREHGIEQSQINTIIGSMNEKFDPRGFQAGLSIYVIYSQNGYIEKIYLPQLNSKYLLVDLAKKGKIQSQLVTRKFVKSLQINS